jgi:hypothetical protein
VLRDRRDEALVRLLTETGLRDFQWPGRVLGGPSVAPPAAADADRIATERG